MEKDLEQRALDAWKAKYTPIFEAYLLEIWTIIVVGMEASDGWQPLVRQQELYQAY